jgi:hypothetical protein
MPSTTETQWTAAMASEDDRSAGLDDHASEVMRELRRQSDFTAYLADALAAGRAVVKGKKIVSPVDRKVLASWDELDKRARGQIPPRERMELLRARAGAKMLKHEEEFTAFVEEELPALNSPDPEVCAHLRAIAQRVWRSRGAFRLEQKQTDAWDIVRGFCDALEDEELCEDAFPSSAEAFAAGLSFGVALARHDPEHLGSRTPTGSARNRHESEEAVAIQIDPKGSADDEVK